MAYAQYYATAAELIADLRLNGDEPGLLARIEEASRHMWHRIGNFVPITESRSFVDAPLSGNQKLQVDPILAVTSITNAGTALTAASWTLLPMNRLWANGPYRWIYHSSAGWSTDNESPVVIPGRYGLYEETVLIGETVTQASSTATTVTVANGANLSPGMTLLIESEQEIVTAGAGSEGSPTASSATSKVVGAVDAAQEEIAVTTGSEFNRGEVIQISTEDVYIRRIVSNTLVCSRGWNGTTKATHSNDAAIGVYRTYTVKRGANGTTAAAHASKAAYKYVIPADVNWMTRQIAGLMRMKAASGFSGRTGNAELGEAFYVNEFPRQLKEVRLNYWVP